MISKIILLALGLTMALACSDYTYNTFFASQTMPSDGCNGSPCLFDQNCALLDCANPPTSAEVEKWMNDAMAGNVYQLKTGTCGGTTSTGLGTGTIIAIIIGVVVVIGGVVGFVMYRRKKNLQAQLA